MRKIFAIILSLLIPCVGYTATRTGNVLFDENGAIVMPEISSTSTESGKGKIYPGLDGRFYFLDGSGNERTNSSVARNTIQVWSMADFPTAVAGVITLPSGSTKYVFNTPITTSDRFVIPTGANVEFTTEFNDDALFTYTGSSALFTSSNPGTITLRELDMFNVGTGTLFAITNGSSDTIIVMELGTLAGWGSIGSISGAFLLSLDKYVFADNVSGLTLDNIFVTQMAGMLWINSFDSASTFLTFQGTTGTDIIDVGNSIAYTQPNESFFYVNPTILSTSSTTLRNNSNRGSGSFFAAGSIKQDDVRMTVKDNPGQADSDAYASMFLITNATVTSVTTTDVPVKIAGTWTSNGRERFNFNSSGRLTFTGREDVQRLITINFGGQNALGVNKDFYFYVSEGNDTTNTIDAFSDSATAPGVDTTVTTTNPHGLSAGDRIPITGTTNYNLVHTITRIVDANNFDINFAYVADDGTGFWAKIAEESISQRRYNAGGISKTPLTYVVSFTTDDYVEFYLQNHTDTTDFTMDKTQFIIR